MKFTIKGYEIFPRETFVGTEGSFGRELIELEFGEDWEGLGVTVSFLPAGSETGVSVLWTGEPFVMPPEVTATRGRCKMAVVGNDDESRAITVCAELLVGALFRRKFAAPPPDVGHHLVALHRDAGGALRADARIEEFGFAVLGEAEMCTGDTARRAGNEYLFYEMARANIETLNAAHPPRILVTCPHCLHTLGKEYPQFGGVYNVVHHTEYLQELMASGRLRVHAAQKAHVTFHDPCYLGRHNSVYDAPRYALGAAGVAVTEMGRTRNDSFCCGAGGAQFWKEEEHGAARVSVTRYAEAAATGAPTLATGCPFCLRMFADASQEEAAAHGPEVRDVAEIIAAQLGLEG